MDSWAKFKEISSRPSWHIVFQRIVLMDRQTDIWTTWKQNATGHGYRQCRGIKVLTGFILRCRQHILKKSTLELTSHVHTHCRWGFHKFPKVSEELRSLQFKSLQTWQTACHKAMMEAHDILPEDITLLKSVEKVASVPPPTWMMKTRAHVSKNSQWSRTGIEKLSGYNFKN